jgi:hypothetical protein
LERFRENCIMIEGLWVVIFDESWFLARTLWHYGSEALLHGWWLFCWLHNPFLELLRRWNVFVKVESWLRDF